MQTLRGGTRHPPAGLSRRPAGAIRSHARSGGAVRFPRARRCQAGCGLQRGGLPDRNGKPPGRVGPDNRPAGAVHGRRCFHRPYPIQGVGLCEAHPAHARDQARWPDAMRSEDVPDMACFGCSFHSEQVKQGFHHEVGQQPAAPRWKKTVLFRAGQGRDQRQFT